MKFKTAYPTLNEVLQCLKIQTYESVPYARRFLPAGRMSPRQIFDFLKSRVTYVNDPPGNELLQTMQTLFDDNKHGTSGAGDCDCFTITALACLHVKGYNSLDVILAGRNPQNPVHIYVECNGVPFDLTNRGYGIVRPYRNIQKIPFYFQQVIVKNSNLNRLL